MNKRLVFVELLKNNIKEFYPYLADQNDLRYKKQYEEIVNKLEYIATKTRRPLLVKLDYRPSKHMRKVLGKTGFMMSECEENNGVGYSCFNFNIYKLMNGKYEENFMENK